MSFVAVGRACDSCGTLVTLSGNSDDASLAGTCPSCSAPQSAANVPSFVGFGDVVPFHERHAVPKIKWSPTVTLPPRIADVPVDHAAAVQAALDAEAAGPATPAASADSTPVDGETELEKTIEAALSTAIKKAAGHGA